jgi:hypothetical protein
MRCCIVTVSVNNALSKSFVPQSGVILDSSSVGINVRPFYDSSHCSVMSCTHELSQFGIQPVSLID